MYHPKSTQTLRASYNTVQMCLEMAIAVALRNRDRLLLIWPHIHEFLAAILAPSQVHGKDKLAHVLPGSHCLSTSRAVLSVY